MDKLSVKDWIVTAKLNQYDELVVIVEHVTDGEPDLVYEITDDTVRGVKYNTIYNYEMG